MSPRPLAALFAAPAITKAAPAITMVATPQEATPQEAMPSELAIIKACPLAPAITKAGTHTAEQNRHCTSPLERWRESLG